MLYGYLGRRTQVRDCLLPIALSRFLNAQRSRDDNYSFPALNLGVSLLPSLSRHISNLSNHVGKTYLDPCDGPLTL